MDKEKLHQILSSLWKNDDSVGKIYYNQALQDAQTAIDLQEEPTDKDFEAALAEEWKGYNDRGAAKVDALEDNTQELAFAKGFYRGWHYNKEKSVSEDLEEASKNYALNNTPWDDCKDEIQESFKAGAEWGKNQAMAEIQAQSMALAHGCPKEPITEDLGDYINELSKQFQEVSFAKLSRIAVRVAKWKEQQLMANAVDGVVHHFEKCKVASVHYNDPTGVPMAYFMTSKGFLAGDKVKVIVIKED